MGFKVHQKPTCEDSVVVGARSLLICFFVSTCFFASTFTLGAVSRFFTPAVRAYDKILMHRHHTSSWALATWECIDQATHTVKYGSIQSIQHNALLVQETLAEKNVPFFIPP